MFDRHHAGRGLWALALSLCALPALAAEGLYATFAYGNAAVDETGDFAVPGLAFPAPTVDHEICATTATITVGVRPVVGGLDDRNSHYRMGIGWRSAGALAWEFGYFNVARLASEARSGAYAVTQPACPDATISARGVSIDRVQANGFSLGPVFHLALSRRVELELRATISAWELRNDSQWQIEVTEFNDVGAELRTYPTAAVSGGRDDSGADLGYGLGLSWQANDDARVRLSLERQTIGDLSIEVANLGLSIGF